MKRALDLRRAAPQSAEAFPRAVENANIRTAGILEMQSDNPLARL